MLDFITLTDGYKVDHRRQYPVGTQHVYSNFTARGSRVPDQKKVVFFGLQYFLDEYLTNCAHWTFFDRPKEVVVDDYQKMLDGYLGPNSVGTDHIAALHDLGYVPLEFRALPEGTQVPLRVPMFTVENTLPDFYWVTNFIETLLSSVMWLPCTSATTATRYKWLLSQYAKKTGGDEGFVPWQGHDFSFRGMGSPEAAALSGAGHLLSFTGTDTIPAIRLLQKYYGAEGLVGGSVPATEHSVMCAGGKADELDTFRRLMKLYPTGILSVVSDTWDLWYVLAELLPKMRSEIMARNGKLVIRPDSGDPVRILTGDHEAASVYPRKGVIPLLWELFGGTVNAKGFKVLDSHIGAIYGDSITEDRARQISARLADLGFASTNVVYGIGSYTYQYTTRDTYGFAVKATWASVDGHEQFLFKDPVTDSGEKKSARGRLVVIEDKYTGLRLVDGLSVREQYAFREKDLLQPVWADGKFIRRTTLAEIRERAATT